MQRRPRLLVVGPEPAIISMYVLYVLLIYVYSALFIYMCHTITITIIVVMFRIMVIIISSRPSSTC